MIKINRALLQDMDYIITTSYSFISDLIRYKTSGKFFDQKIGTHAGIIFRDGKDFSVGEMMPRGLEKNPLSSYEQKGFLKSHAVCILRNPIYNDQNLRLDATTRLIDDIKIGIDYDYKGIAEYIIPQIKDKDSIFYCSELIAHYSLEDGYPLCDNPKEDDITPYGLQINKRLNKIWI